MDEVGWMPTSSIKIERGQHYRLTLSGGTTWAGTALTSFRLLSPTDCPVDSRVAECFRYQFAAQSLRSLIRVGRLACRRASVAKGNSLSERAYKLYRV